MKNGGPVAPVIKINSVFQISRLPGLSIIYHLISYNKLWRSLCGGAVPLNLLSQSGLKTTVDAAEAEQHTQIACTEIAAVN